MNVETHKTTSILVRENKGQKGISSFKNQKVALFLSIFLAMRSLKWE